MCNWKECVVCVFGGCNVTDFKSGKEYVKAVYCHPAYLTSMQSTAWKTLDRMKHKLESRLPGEISITSDMQMTQPYGRKQRTKEPLESDRGEWKSWLKTQYSENEDHGIQSHHFMANRWENSGNSESLYFGGLQNHCRWWLKPWIKRDACSLEGKLWPT